MEFIKGADVSSLQAMEDYGAKFYDLNGNEADALAILQGHGVNYIRLRLFHQPTSCFMISLEQVGFVNRFTVRAKEHVNQLAARNH